MYDLIIIGGGPAGVAAGVYASRKQLKTLLVTKDWGGQSIVSTDIQNWIGTPSISGDQLAKDLKNHIETYAKDIVTLKSGSLVTAVEKIEGGFEVTLEDGTIEKSQTVLLAMGSDRRKLNVPGADTFEHKGLTYCASCDGPMFSGQEVAVIGGGNAGFETAAQLAAYTKHVTILHRKESFQADPVTVKRVLENDNITGILNANTTEILGDKFLSGLNYKIGENGEEINLPVTGVFVEIGMIPNTAFTKDIVELDDYNRVKIDFRDQKTSTPGIWAAGDCTNVLYHQNNISAGDAVRALEDIYVTLKTK